MDEKFAKLFTMMAEMKAGQDEMRKGQKELKDQIQMHVESQVKGIKDHVNSCMEKIEEDVQSVEREIGEVRDKAGTNIEVVQERIGNLEKKLSELEDRPNNFLPSPEFSYTRPTVKPLTFDGQTSWTVFKTQFDVVMSTNGWTDAVKASQLVASLRGSAAEVLQGIKAEKLMDLMTIEKALESRFGDIHLTQFYRTELKTRRQKAGENLQVLAADVERLMSLAYAECPRDVRESLAVQYFVDAIRDEGTQLATRLMDEKDLKSALAYSMKYEAAKTVSRSPRHVRPIEIQNDAGRKSYDKFESLCRMLEKLVNSRYGEKNNIPRRKPNVT
ncbi:uncharacterized protein LOC129963054 [Argiope bruennichi]|uniref:uncharacterized protein LOC129963054 n=1 Tax=Argiope bruennichi TaxID=94029 RepID=UPI00249556D3|nr:uncharacterized protein LOC129963054 [Argiope bruennichi]